MGDIPTDLASLVDAHFRIIDDADSLRFDARRGVTHHGPASYPTPRGGPFVDYPARLEAGRIFHSGGGSNSIDLFHLVFQPGQVEQFRSDLEPPDFAPLRSASAVAFNTWRRMIVLDEGCERLKWGICDEPHPDTMVLLICNTAHSHLTPQSP